MKKFLFTAAVAALFLTACNTKPADVVAPTTDSSVVVAPVTTTATPVADTTKAVK